MQLHVNNISKRFSDQSTKLTALQEVSFVAQPGEFICLLGPSGCGKSSLLNLISGIEQPSQGSIVVEGKIGFMFQEAALFPWLKVKDNIAFGLKMQDVSLTKQRELVERYLQMVHLTGFADSYPHQLSGGMKQRVALARTLILEPDILLMDEPFGALDAQTRELLYGELQQIWQQTKTTVIFVTHNVREAVCLGDRVIVFTARPGKIKQQFQISLPRPRNINDPALAQLSSEVMQALKTEIQL